RYSDNAQLGYKDTDLYLFQDETPDSVITESYHIRGKAYYYVLANKSTTSKYKGVSKKSISEMAMNSYMPALEGSLLDDCLFDKEVFYAKNVRIHSKDHILSLVESEKKALCPIDTKHWILSDKIT
ncbi:2318_t:CDS:2, partial [Cetraspora pellucida]